MLGAAIASRRYFEEVRTVMSVCNERSASNMDHTVAKTR